MDRKVIGVFEWSPFCDHDIITQGHFSIPCGVHWMIKGHLQAFFFGTCIELGFITSYFSTVHVRLICSSLFVFFLVISTIFGCMNVLDFIGYCKICKLWDG